jgi:hypothetical protein
MVKSEFQTESFGVLLLQLGASYRQIRGLGKKRFRGDDAGVAGQQFHDVRGDFAGNAAIYKYTALSILVYI